MILKEIHSLPKADLHVHLNGAIPTHTAKKLLTPITGKLPSWFDMDNDLQIKEPVNGLQNYFKPWHGLKKLPYSKECLDLMIESALSSLFDDNVNYVELRNSPFNISEINEIPLEEALTWLIHSVDTMSTRIGIEAKLILSLSRYNFSTTNAKKLLNAIRSINYNDIIVGVDLSGNEDTPISSDISDFFRTAKRELGLGVTIHAGETGNIQNIVWAINDCKADRISHGLVSYKSPELMDQLCQKNICLEICLYSNYLIRTVQAIEEHPIKAFIKNGVSFVLCSDNPAINNADLSKNYFLFKEITGNNDILRNMYDCQKRYSFGGKH